MLACFCSQDGRTALHLAATYGNYEIVKILVSACANVDTTTIKVSVLLILLWSKLRGGSPSAWVGGIPKLCPNIQLIVCHYDQL